MIQVISVEDALGCRLAHDITEIRPGEFKGPAFHRGHTLTCRDMDHLRRLGKDHLYVITPESNELHEDEAAELMADALCGEGVGWTDAPREGKISIKATRNGLFKVDVEALFEFNNLGDVMCATRHTNTVVKKGEQVAATRAIPLLIDRSSVDAALAAAAGAGEAVLRVKPMFHARAGVLITGNEVYSGRIEDKFQPVIRKKVS
ncbi:MAG: molybdopterin-binding protein, partial [Desulfamplus sp.]|nr:molybdopterin-binding protein [Desulfamplus sp.]